MQSLVNSLSVVANGGRVIKSVTPHFLRLQQMLNTGIVGTRKSSAGAAAVLNPTVDAGFTYGTTGQISSVVESLSLPFEMIWCNEGQGRELTWLDTRNLASCELRLNCNPFASLLSAANTAPVVFTLSTLSVEITLVEAVGVLPNAKFKDYRQTVKSIPFGAEVRASQIEINKGNRLAGLMFYTVDGAGGSTTTATDRIAVNSLLKDMVLKKNGAEDLKSTTFLQLQDENRARYGVSAPYATNVSILDGCAHMNLITNGNILTALNASQGQVDSLYLYVDTGIATTEVSYTNPAYVSIMTDEICDI